MEDRLSSGTGSNDRVPSWVLFVGILETKDGIYIYNFFWGGECSTFKKRT